MILQKIAYHTKRRVEGLKAQKPPEDIRKAALACVGGEDFTFEKALSGKELSFICEIKKASPSKGTIVEDLPYLQIARNYEQAGADAISVLTEPEFFKGLDRYLTEVKQVVNIPVLRKDFTVDAYQIYEAKAIGADAVLLICSLLPTETLRQFIAIADELGLSCLVEAHTEQEVCSALEAGARIVGVNNRNLNTFEVNLSNSLNLRKLVPEGILFVSESGVKTTKDIDELRRHEVDAVLVGEMLMRSADRVEALAMLKGSCL